MALPREYSSENCPIARALEVVGERWSLLLLRDAFYGVRRFSDFHAHLRIPKAVLSQRLSLLVEQGVLTIHDGEYTLTDVGRALWPVLDALAQWGAQNYQRPEHRRSWRHADCDAVVRDGRCTACGARPDVGDLVMVPPRRFAVHRDDPVSTALRRPRRMLEPLRPNAT